MSTLDQKAPPEPPGSADLLDALVQDHLDRTEASPEAQGNATDPAPSSDVSLQSAAAPNPQISEEQRVSLLQKEIETLLRDTPGAAQTADPDFHSPAPGAVPTAAAAQSPLAAPAPDTSPPPMASAPAITADELSVLLAGTPPPPANSLGAEPTLSPSETEARMSEAEGVLAEELAQLIEENATQAATTTTPAPAPPAAANTAPTGAPHVEPPASPPPPADPLPTSIAGPSSPVPSADLPAIPTAPSASLPPAASPAPAAALSAPLPDPPHAKELPPPRGAMASLLLAFAQLVDLPFAWLNDLDKHIIGIAALLLLLGGAVLWFISCFVR